ncbi:MAG: sugar transferase [Pseudomonadota bacterium]
MVAFVVFSFVAAVTALVAADQRAPAFGTRARAGRANAAANGMLDPRLVSLSDLQFRPSAPVIANGFRVWAIVERFFDVVAATIGIVISAPFVAIAAILIKMETPGPAFYAQKRIGKDGSIFTIYKLRSMPVDAEENGPQWDDHSNARATRIGSFLRRYHLDELPQLYNVLRGDMRIVGPRPERPEFVFVLDRLLPNYSLRHLVKPGITGWAQVNFTYGASVEDSYRKLKYDLYYIRKRSLLQDGLIIALTFRAVLFGAPGK